MGGTVKLSLLLIKLLLNLHFCHVLHVLHQIIQPLSLLDSDICHDVKSLFKGSKYNTFFFLISEIQTDKSSCCL